MYLRTAVLLGIRFLLRLFGANTQNEFARLINNLSAPFIAPFSTLFISPTFGGGAYIFDVNIAISVVAYQDRRIVERFCYKPATCDASARKAIIKAAEGMIGKQ